MIFVIVIYFTVVSFIGFICDFFYWFLWGCGRKFKNGRKCKLWSYPNQKECPFFNVEKKK